MTHAPAGDAHDHGDHAHHSPEMFLDRFWLSLILTVPILYFSEQFEQWFSYQAVVFPGSELVNPVLGTFLFFWAGRVFLEGAGQEIAGRQPGMMTLISLAISVACIFSMAVTLGLPGMPFFWELATLLVIMLLGHWLEMASVEGASSSATAKRSNAPATSASSPSTRPAR